MKTRIIVRLIITLICWLLCVTNIQAQVISVEDFGLKPNSRVNAVPYIQKALETCKNQQGATLLFPKGRYDFWPEYTMKREYFETNTYDNNPKTLAVLLDSLRDTTIDGGGSTFIMHGRMQPFTLDHCKNIVLRNFTIDWDIPLTAQAIVRDKQPDYMEIEIDTCQYPYVIENNKLTFVGEGWKSVCWSLMQFDPQTHFVKPETGDNLGWTIFHAEEVRSGVVRLSDPTKKLNTLFPQAGTILVLRHNEREHAGIFVYHSVNTLIEHVTLHHTGGLGILSQYSKEIHFDDVHIVPNKNKGRLFSGHDDGFHFMGCSGKLKIENCSWAGLMDDPINIHGTCSRIIEKVSPTLFKCRFMQSMSQGMEWGRPDELIGFIEPSSMRTMDTNVLKNFKAINKSDFLIELKNPVPEHVTTGFVIENLSCTADADIRNNYFGSCRARGLLVSTPGKVVIENNLFESSGSAILIAGDANAWYESGAVKDVTIRNNEFRYPCNSSLYQFCEAVISILPEIPKVDSKHPYHRNIHIENNTFHLFDFPILFARSVDGLSFQNNKLIRNYIYRPYHYRKEGITLEACKDVRIGQTIVEGDVLGSRVKIKNMDNKELTFKNEVFFNLSE